MYPKPEKHRDCMNHQEIFELKRQELIQNYNLILKEEFKNHDHDSDETSDEDLENIDFNQ